MIDRTALAVFNQQFDDLLSIVSESNRRVTMDPIDQLFESYLNVFTKSYIVSACSILEAFIQDVLFAYVTVMEDRIIKLNVPRNIIMWPHGETKKALYRFEAYKTGIEKDKIADEVSANFFKTIKVFEKIGIDLEGSEEFNRYSDFIGATVEKRNKIVHHNDEASDISLPDVIGIIKKFKEYTEAIFHIVEKSPHLSEL
ncbi:HEPN domain-containing protein [Rhizobium leguminosarum]|uniref:HEPN domain-containing protein n=1 Tax=Rhizobium leguminosarum TaxID=384 RepID=UPI001030C349|nr:HEPN domain-containing protein [Rhizobium leguminosarum]TAX30527.1 hypothetical protein ELI04_12500 [Rhizobium leguminosarum]TAY33340.1 hypothetical protein ELH93_12320 [Rhizobium leguminosarum]